MDSLEAVFCQFVKRHKRGGRPLLLALSGGPDSLALFHLLLHYRQDFHVAHVDHGWRPESSKEALIIKTLCSDNHIPFHLKKLSKVQEKNQEDWWRQKRIQFFEELSKTFLFEAVLLGHHADDQAETVLKRVFEGANLSTLKGLMPVVCRENLWVWRPFLAVRKQKILLWLKEKNITPFYDGTNEDERFLRGRCRKELFPLLSKTFGKEIAPSLCRLAHSASELHEFVERLLLPYRQRFVRESGELFLDLSVDYPQTIFEWKVVLKDFLQQEDMIPSQSHLETIIRHLKNLSSFKVVFLGKRKVILHRGVASIPKADYNHLLSAHEECRFSE